MATGRKPRSGGDNYGIKRRLSTYTPDQLNQYASRKVPSSVDIVGTAHADATVTVDAIATQRKGDYFRAEVALDNLAGPVYQTTTIRGVRPDGGQDVLTTETRSLMVPPATQTFTYDDDGNLTSDGVWTYTWDAEDRLVSMTAANQRKLDFKYDYLRRRVQKDVYTWSGGWGTPVVTKFIYDGWSLLAELNSANNVIRSYMWGLDLSGSEQGAGGVGGLLSVKDSTATHFAVYDGNGNIMALVKNDGASSAQYEYGPFGEAVHVTGSMGPSNPIRWSTKYTDTESGLTYYGLRYYMPDAAKWLNRDPIGDNGGLNVYGFIYNSPLIFIDPIGLCPCKCKTLKGGPVNDRVLHKGSPPGKNEVGLILIVPWDIEVDGDPAKCHCRYIDDGTIHLTGYFKNGKSEEKTEYFRHRVKKLDCVDFLDLPGAYFPMGLPDFTFSIRFKLNVTFECEDEDRSQKISDTVNINGLFLGTYPPTLDLP